MLKTTILWIHALSGALWVGICVTFILATAGTDEGERSAFIKRIAPSFNRLNLAAAVIMPITGIANLYFAGRARDFTFSNAFIEILSAKVALLLGMAIALSAAWGAGWAKGPRRLLRLYGAMALMGVAALGLGLWLAGTG